MSREKEGLWLRIVNKVKGLVHMWLLLDRTTVIPLRFFPHLHENIVLSCSQVYFIPLDQSLKISFSFFVCIF